MTFHTKSVHAVSVSTQTDVRETRDHSSQTVVSVEELHSGDRFICDKCEKTFDAREMLRNHTSTFHEVDASVQTDKKLNCNLTIQAHDSREQPKILKGYTCFYCDDRINNEDYLKKHKEECHGRTEKSSAVKLKSSIRQENPSLPNLLSFPPFGFPLHGSTYFPPLKM